MLTHGQPNGVALQVPACDTGGATHSARRIDFPQFIKVQEILEDKHATKQLMPSLTLALSGSLDSSRPLEKTRKITLSVFKGNCYITRVNYIGAHLVDYTQIVPKVNIIGYYF